VNRKRKIREELRRKRRSIILSKSCQKAKEFPSI